PLVFEMLQFAGTADALAARGRLEQGLSDGSALRKFAEVIEGQGGDARVVDDPSLLPQTRGRRGSGAPRAPGGGTRAFPPQACCCASAGAIRSVPAKCSPSCTPRTSLGW